MTNLVKRSNGPNPNGDVVEIYYGAKWNEGQPAGNYRCEVLYSLVAETSTVAIGELTVEPKTVTGAGELIKIKTSLATNMELGSILVRIGESVQCTDIKLIKSNPVTITCKVPARPVGNYGLKVEITGLNKTYSKANAIEYKLPHQNLLQAVTNLQDVSITNRCTSTYTPTVNATQSTRSANFGLNDYVPEALLRDSRDGKTYIVRKLADGKCWMTQNLDLDLSTGRRLYPTTTDMISGPTNGWVPSHNTNTVVTVWGSATTEHRSFNPGEKYLTGTGTYQIVSSTGEKTAHVGNLYNWHAATAGSSASAVGGVAPYSICPRGWRMPVGGANSDYRNLMNIYGVISSGNNGDNDLKTRSFPLNFVRGGHYSPGSGTHNNMTGEGYVWINETINAPVSSPVKTMGHAAAFMGVDELRGGDFGFNLRCVAR